MSAYQTLRVELSASPQRWLVSGAAGFIGSHLVEALLRLGQEVVGMDNFATGHRYTLDALQSRLDPAAWSRFELHQADVCDASACHEACDGARYVLHQAALTSVQRSFDDPLAAHEVNVEGFLQLALAARD
ncbi:MAG: NAD-dependent epimerase/dehydratase family protein, partial [Myxococcota bacterium]